MPLRTSHANVPGVSIDPAPADGINNFVLRNAKQFQAEASGDAVRASAISLTVYML
jgi:hypothetical protein